MNDKNKNILKFSIIVLILVSTISGIMIIKKIMEIDPLSVSGNDQLDFLHNKTANHGSILINTNTELATFIDDEGLSGNGTVVSPYIIENFVINASTANGIEINNTDAYLIIQNCMVFGKVNSRHNGVYLGNTTNVNIKNNTLINMDYGFILDKSTNSTLSRNIVNTWAYIGFGIYNSSMIFLFQNEVRFNSYGFDISDSYNITLSNNNVTSDCDYGIYLNNSNDNYILQNNAVSGGNGIYLRFSNNNTLSQNKAHHNFNGIEISLSNNNFLSQNSANNNYFASFKIWESSNNTIYGNEANNCKYGILFQDSGKFASSDNNIYFNDIYGNQEYQSKEGYYNTGNRWDNGTHGNYWGNDYIRKYNDAMNDGSVWDTPYEIEGDGLGIDHFPLVNSVITGELAETREISGFPFVNTLFFVSVGVCLLNRKINLRNRTPNI